MKIRQVLAILKGKIFNLLGLKSNYANLIQLKKAHKLLIGFGTYGWQSMQIDYYKGCEDIIVSIGKFCSIGPNVRIITSGIHPPEWISTYPLRRFFNHPKAFKDGMPASKGNITINNDVWIGTEVMILSGVTIGDGAVIMARAVVTRNVPPYSIVGGVPAKVIKYRFSKNEINFLQHIEWWNKDIVWIRKHLHILSSDRILELMELVEDNFKSGERR